jgi:5-methylcytosine-specific restriction endonuclease McrA
MPHLCPSCDKPSTKKTIEKYGVCGRCRIRKTSIPLVLREMVWCKYFKNSFVGTCDVCNDSIKFTNHACAHIISEYNGGSTDIDNLIPLCHKCNLSMGSRGLSEFKKIINPNAVYFTVGNTNIQTKIDNFDAKYFMINNPVTLVAITNFIENNPYIQSLSMFVNNDLLIVQDPHDISTKLEFTFSKDFCGYPLLCDLDTTIEN